MSNVLIVGVNSPLAIVLSEQYKKIGYSVYGLSSNPPKNNINHYTNVINYEGNYSGIGFSEVVIIGSRVPSQGGSIEEFIVDNLSIVEKAMLVGGKARYIFISSFSVYDQSHAVVELDTPYTKSDPYGISKLMCEKLLQDKAWKVLILRVPVLLCNGVKNNFMANLKYQIETNGSFNFSSPDSKVNAFFTADDYFKVVNYVETGIINCCTELDWKIDDLIQFSLNRGLAKYNVIPPKKPPQIVSGSKINFSKTSIAIMNFLNGKIDCERV